MDGIRLTQMTAAGGCGAKMGPGVLGKLLAGLPSMHDENLLVGFGTSDDAAVYRIDDQTALVATVDFFPPIVDDPFIFGQIAATNALSDIYAMGASPRLALNLFAFPAALPHEVAQAILAGGQDKVAEAGAIIAGGHSIDDREPKYGLCALGFVNPARMLKNSGARAGDALVLTKPVGVGILSTAAKAGLLRDNEYRAMVSLMTTLNRAAMEAILPETPSACTDVTGFGLLGHAAEMARGSSVSIALNSARVPIAPRAAELAREGIVPGGAYRNREHLGDSISLGGGVSREMADVLFDPQTAGGLLVAIPEARANDLLKRLHDAGVPAAAIGYAAPKGKYAVRVE